MSLEEKAVSKPTQFTTLSHHRETILFDKNALGFAKSLRFTCICPQRSCCQGHTQPPRLKSLSDPARPHKMMGVCWGLPLLCFLRKAWHSQPNPSLPETLPISTDEQRTSPPQPQPVQHAASTQPLQLPKTPHVVILPCCSEFLA